MKSKVVEVTATVGQTIQVKQYEPRTYQATVKIEVDPTETSKDVFIEARRIANEEVENYFNNLNEKIKQKKNKVKYTGTKPEILTHPNIPKPLHGINPRTIKGTAWWNKTRQEVYASTDYHCVACGTPKEEVKGRNKWLEAHEFWDIDYEKGTAEVNSIEPLCPYCHGFIHSGRLSKIIGKEVSEAGAISILEHGFKVLSDNNLKCFPGTLELAEEIGANTYGVVPYSMPPGDVAWGDWKLIFEGNEHKSQFKDYDEWEKFYENKK